jgi:N-acetylneuraminic acid mutarotase
LSQVEEYDPIFDTWSLKTGMSSPLAYFGSVVKNNQIYVIGGTSGFRPSQEHNSLRVYSPSKDVWADIEPPMSILKGKVTAVLASDE